MGRNVIVSGAVTLLGLSLAGAGCQQSGPLRLSVMSDMQGGHFVENKDAAYVNVNWVEVDEEPDGAVNAAVSTTGAALETVFKPFVDLSVRGVQWLNHDRPSTADKMLEDGTNPDNRREGINKLADFGFLKNQVFTSRCRQLAQDDTDFTVRATAIRTANRARDPKATPLFIKGLIDPNEWVRLESAKALANIPDINAVEPLVSMLNNQAENRDVRVAAADALKHYRVLQAARALCAMLSDKTFVIAWQSRRSLHYMTDRDLGYDSGAWLAYFTGTEKSPG